MILLSFSRTKKKKRKDSHDAVASLAGRAARRMTDSSGRGVTCAHVYVCDLRAHRASSFSILFIIYSRVCVCLSLSLSSSLRLYIPARAHLLPLRRIPIRATLCPRRRARRFGSFTSALCYTYSLSLFLSGGPTFSSSSSFLSRACIRRTVSRFFLMRELAHSSRRKGVSTRDFYRA